MRYVDINTLPDFSSEFETMLRERRDYAYQYALFETPLQHLPSQEEPSDKALPVNFREIVSEIENTNYLTHGLFYYPAKFIPHVPYYCVRRFCPEAGWVIDPFAGSGTVGLEAVLAQRNAILIDINPLLKHIVDLKINFRHFDVEESPLLRCADAMFCSIEEFEPDWQNISYWYPPDILDTLKRYWGWIHGDSQNIYAQILQCSLLRASRRFSLADHKAPKLFRSRAKLREIEQLMQSDWASSLRQFILEHSVDVLRRVRSLAKLTSQHNCRAIPYAGVDSASVQVDVVPSVDLVVTSPPYVQAQEYIRTFKLDLFWLGYSQNEVREASRLEIPYRKASQHFHSPTYDQLYEKVARDDLRQIMNSYFYYTTQSLWNAASKLRRGGYMCVFVGNPKIDGIEIETWRVIAEHFECLGFEIYGVYEDTIKSRQLFRGRRNKNPEGMTSEFLLVMQRIR